jgi:surfactin synthase thioesterase subunit
MRDDADAVLSATRLWLNMRPGLQIPSCLLLLIPHAGAGPSSVRAIEKVLPSDWGVFALSLPGRELRITEPPQWDIGKVSQEAAQAAQMLLEAIPQPLPLLVAGQCSGAWLAHAILDQGGRQLQEGCRALFVIAQTPWHLPRSPDLLPEDSDAMWAQLLSTGDTPADVAADAEMREILEPVIRADHEAVARFPAHAGPVVCPIVAVAGKRDPFFGQLRSADWARYAPSLRTVLIDSGHLPMQESPEEVARVVASALRDG